MQPSWSLVTEGVVAGVLLGGLHGAVSVGFSIAFGLVNVVNIARPVILVIGTCCVLHLSALGIDPALTGIGVAPVFGVAGCFLYQAYSAAFERRQLSSLSSVTFLFGLMFALEIGLTLAFAVAVAVLGVVESSVQTFAGAQWSVATGFTILLIMLGIWPQGILSR